MASAVFRHAVRMHSILLALIVATSSVPQSVADPSRASTVVAFDFWNSMWGQIEGRSKVEADSGFDVAFTGPENQNDFIIIVPAGADPDASGNYELRYMTAQDRDVLARLPITAN